MRLRLPDRDPVDYQVLRLNSQWPDHILRTNLTADLIAWLHPKTIIDPACGDGSIVAEAHRRSPLEGAYLADISTANYLHVTKEAGASLPMALRTARQGFAETLSDPFTYDVCVLTEFLEHIEDPVAALRMARERASFLVASSPWIEPGDEIDPNPEHLWQFDVDGYREMLEEAGWEPTVLMPVRLFEHMYDFQIWVAK